MDTTQSTLKLVMAMSNQNGRMPFQMQHRPTHICSDWVPSLNVHMRSIDPLSTYQPSQPQHWVSDVLASAVAKCSQTSNSAPNKPRYFMPISVILFANDHGIVKLHSAPAKREASGWMTTRVVARTHRVALVIVFHRRQILAEVLHR